MDIFLGVLLLLVAHYIGDFYCQSRYIAEKKSENLWVLIKHVGIYSMVLFVILFTGLYLLNIVSLLHAFQMAIGITFVNGLLHYMIDFFTSKMNSHFWKTKQVRNFWLTIGFDQLLHTGILVYCYADMLNNFNYI